MKANPLKSLLRLARRPDARLHAIDLEQWPPEFVGQCQEAGLLVEAGAASTVPCTNCHGNHAVEVVTAWRDAGEPFSIATCAETGIVQLTDEATKQWRLSMQGWVGLVRDGLRIDREPDELEPSHAWCLRHAVVQDHVVRIIVASHMDARWVREGDRVFVAHGEGEQIQGVRRILLGDVFEWSQESGITFNPDVAGPLTDSIAQELRSDGFVAPDQVVVAGQIHRCAHLTLLEQQLLHRVGGCARVPITELVSKDASALWRERWRHDEKRLISRIRTAFNGLNLKLMAASPPVPFRYSVSVKHEAIRRVSRK